MTKGKTAREWFELVEDEKLKKLLLNTLEKNIREPKWKQYETAAIAFIFAVDVFILERETGINPIKMYDDFVSGKIKLKESKHKPVSLTAIQWFVRIENKNIRNFLIANSYKASKQRFKSLHEAIHGGCKEFGLGNRPLYNKKNILGKLAEKGKIKLTSPKTNK